ncbi:MAG: hypothetical protein OXI22_06080, partial [Defluviicoccus sp.]|nr:hypothetical protein [Defluviicoccus sp.]
EIAELPNLRKGYSDTHRRGVASYREVFERLARPAAGASGDAAQAVAALSAARSAALADPEGDALRTVLVARPGEQAQAAE